MNFSLSVQFSCGYFLADMAMMFHHYPNLGRLEFVSYTVLLWCFSSNPDGAELQKKLFPHVGRLLQIHCVF
jgi:hypothetical protein